MPTRYRRKPRTKVTVIGNCCWITKGTTTTLRYSSYLTNIGRTEKFAPGTRRRTPRFPFIIRARAMKC